MTSATRSLAIVCALASAASADIWTRAIEATDATKDRYELALQRGDDLALRANARGQNRTEATKRIDDALAAYRDAASLRTDQGEPFFRIASVLDSFYDCDSAAMYSPQGPPVTCPGITTSIDLARAREQLDAWDQFEARAPLDPRVADAMFNRAILRTKLVDGAKDPKPLLEGALKDYLALLNRADGMSHLDPEQIWGNLAETYMMLGTMEEAIDAYRTAIRMGGGASTAYGLAVALDRDDNFAGAESLIRSMSPMEFQRFRQQYALHQIFYVPHGEEYYYFALIFEVYGYTNEAIGNWKSFLASGAHPQFQARAKKHLDDLVTKQKTQPAARTRPPLDPYDLYP